MDASEVRDASGDLPKPEQNPLPDPDGRACSVPGTSARAPLLQQSQPVVATALKVVPEVVPKLTSLVMAETSPEFLLEAILEVILEVVPELCQAHSWQWAPSRLL